MADKITVKSTPKKTPNDPALVQIDGKTFNFQALNQALSHAASAPPGTVYSVEVEALPEDESKAPTKAS